MLPGAGNERICHVVILRDGKSSILTDVFLRIGRNPGDLFAVQVFFGKIYRSLDSVHVPPFGSSGVRSVSGGNGARRDVVGAANDLHCGRDPGMQTTGMHFA